METRNLLVQIALIVLAAFILFKVFDIDANQKIIKNSIEKSMKEIEFAEKNLAAALDEITNLEKQIEIFKQQRDLLEKEREAIVKNYQDAQEEEKEVLTKIKAEIESNNEKLDELRELNKIFERTTSDGIVVDPMLGLKDLIKEASNNLREYRTE